MDPDSTASIVILVVSLVLHAFVAAAKEAIVSVRKSRRLQLIEEGHPGAEQLDSLAEDASRLLATEQLALKFISFFFIAFAVSVYTSPLAQAISVSHITAVALIIVGSVLVVLILGELIPREIARNHAEVIALRSIYLLYFLSHLATPVARAVTRISWTLTGRPDDGESGGLGVITEEDLLTYVDASEEGGALKKDEKAMIYSIFNLDDTLAREIMVPRIDVVAIEVETSLMAALDAILEAGHSRVPVYRDNIDNVVGILYAKDLLAYWRDGGEPGSVQSLLREVYYVPETKPVSELLRELQKKKVHIAIVVDEYGGMAGLVTIEDILEEIVGEIQDEYDSEEFFMERISDNEYIFNARADLDDINTIMSIDLPTDESDTLGGLVYAMLGRVPEVGDFVEAFGFRLTVLTVEGRRIGTVKIQRLKDKPGGGPVGKKLPAEEQQPSKLVGDTRSTKTVSGSP
ncbi:MAG: HlyC/CorC family transporter [Anaerolineae bacterium]|nr:HlyC/CorC family transporter [Anaerolineae bacterium]